MKRTAEKMENDNPKISVVTVTYNSAATLSDTVNSVLGQTYAPYEYIIIDGLSSDDTVKIAESFRPGFEKKGITFKIVSEKDDGIYDAMNKGIALCTGDIVGIINSDDWYESDALSVVADAYAADHFELFYADLRMVMLNGKSFIKHSKNRRYATSRDWNHPTTFIARSVYEKYTYRTQTLHDDYDLILRLKRDNVKTTVVNKVIANFRMNGKSHSRSVRAALSSMRTKYMIYRQNGYSCLYFFECAAVEIGKLIIG